MKVLIWSDIHLHAWHYGSTLVNGVNSRLLAQREVMHKIAEYIQENWVDRVVFCGDLFHTANVGKIDTTVLKVAYDGISEIMSADLDFKMDMLVGNHDTATKDMSVHALHWLNAIPRVRVIDRPVHHPNQFSYLPYTEDEEVLKKFFKDANEICFMHQGLVDVPMASGFVVNEIMNVDMIPDHVRHVFTGHYHPLHMLEKATVVGSVMQHNWADMGDERGFLVVDTDTLAIKQVNTHASRFQMLDMCGCGSLGDSATDDTWCERNTFKNNYIRCTNFDEAAIPNLRKEILSCGAASVDFVIKRKTYRSNVVKAISGKGLSVPELVREYEDEHSISQERRKVGKELMK